MEEIDQIFKGFLFNCEVFNGLHIEFILLYLLLFYRERVDWLVGIYRQNSSTSDIFGSKLFQQFFEPVNDQENVNQIYMSICESNGKQVDLIQWAVLGQDLAKLIKIEMVEDTFSVFCTSDRQQLDIDLIIQMTP